MNFLFLLIFLLFFCGDFSAAIWIILAIALIVYVLGWWSLVIPAVLTIGICILYAIGKGEESPKERLVAKEAIQPRFNNTTHTPNAILMLYKGRNVNLSQEYIFAKSKASDTKESFDCLVARGFLSEWQNCNIKMVHLSKTGEIVRNNAIRYKYKNVLNYSDEEIFSALQRIAQCY